LNLATRHRKLDQPTHAVFLSGNGPLVAVLREALTRDEVARQKSRGIRVRKGKVAESIKAFIQNVHHFRDDALIDTGPPPEHVAIFDEAQRAWNLRQTANFMRRRKNRHGFPHSEPEFLISCMDRHLDWAVVICLVGGGQEINTGEAGIDAWLEAINSKFPHWHMYISSRLTDSEYAAGNALDIVRQRQNTHFDDRLHLAVSMRSFRAENVSAFVKALLDCEIQTARDAFKELAARYPIAVTRNLNRAKQWIRNHARGTERFGLVSSSKAQRLKPYAIDIRVNVDPVQWFLNSKEDTRSSYYLEDAATEFQVQGLELDWACVTWDGDLRFTDSGWSFHDFRSDKWCNIINEDNRRYLKNAYRVLLTRARQGMVIFVPPGDSGDRTRLPGYYDATFQYFTKLGIPSLT
jgi:Schlafen group 3, DNA/RNA helicase domain